MTRKERMVGIGMLTKHMVPMVLAVMLVLFSVLIPNFCTVGNIINIFSSFAVYGVVTIAMALALICGEFDLSVGSIMAFSSLIFATLVNEKTFAAAAAAALLSGAVVGAANGFLVAKFNIPSFVVTMGMQITVKGAACLYTDAKPVAIYSDFCYTVGNGALFGIPYLVWAFFVIWLLAGVLLKYTAFGRGLYAVGGNYLMAKNAGINAPIYKFMVFFILGIASALGGIMMACRISAGNALYGMDLTMAAISANVVGGTSTVGGTGNIRKTLLGLIVLYVLYNALMLLGIQAYVQQLIKGLIVIIVIVIDGLSRVANEN
ncbi:MAG: ABC transporter permease [Lachnospiraceae bacterium]|jgi:ribose transport system permease protein|nr:ABC transporter permease [Lachnospiraceae bacterium]